jgi:hypothetical protein
MQSILALLILNALSASAIRVERSVEKNSVVIDNLYPNFSIFLGEPSLLFTFL